MATIPPVEPAETTAAAWPRRTSWQATAMLDRGRRQLASAPSSIESGVLGRDDLDLRERIVLGQQRPQLARDGR